MAKQGRLYNVQATMTLLVSIEISAKDFDEATAHAKTLKEGDFVTTNGELMDSNDFRVTGVYEG